MFKAGDTREHPMRCMTRNIIWYVHQSIGKGFDSNPQRVAKFS